MTNLQHSSPNEIDPKTQFVVVSPYTQQEEPGIDMADIAIAAWKNRKLLFISWVILAVATYSVISLNSKIVVSTVLRSGIINSQTVPQIQTADQIRDQVTNDLFPRFVLEMQAQQTAPNSTAIKTAVGKSSFMVEVTITTSLKESEAILLLSQLTEAWLKGQNEKIQRLTKQANEEIAIYKSQSASTLAYISTLTKSSDPLQQSEGNRLRVAVDDYNFKIFELNRIFSNIEQPFVRIPFDSLPSRMSGIQRIGISVIAGGFLAIGVAFLAGIVRTAKLRLQTS